MKIWTQIIPITILPIVGWGQDFSRLSSVKRKQSIGILFKMTTKISPSVTPTNPPFIIEWVICHRNTIDQNTQNLGTLQYEPAKNKYNIIAMIIIKNKRLFLNFSNTFSYFRRRRGIVRIFKNPLTRRRDKLVSSFSWLILTYTNAWKSIENITCKISH